MINKLLIGIAVLLFCAVVLAIVHVFRPPEMGQVTLQNRANELIVEATVQVCNQKISLGKLQPGEERPVKFEVRGESDYALKIGFNSGRQIDTRVGYVTSGLPANDKLVVESDKVVLEAPAPIRK
jgi:hypothetical protein